MLLNTILLLFCLRNYLLRVFCTQLCVVVHTEAAPSHAWLFSRDNTHADGHQLQTGCSSLSTASLSIQTSLPTLHFITAIRRKSHTHTHGLLPLSHVALTDKLKSREKRKADFRITSCLSPSLLLDLTLAYRGRTSYCHPLCTCVTPSFF